MAAENAAAAIQFRERTPSNSSAAPSNVIRMIDTETLKIIDGLMDERDEILAKIDPTLQSSSIGEHANIAVLDGWADGLISDEYIEAYMAAHHSCRICEDNYQYYRKLKQENANC